MSSVEQSLIQSETLISELSAGDLIQLCQSSRTMRDSCASALRLKTMQVDPYFLFDPRYPVSSLRAAFVGRYLIYPDYGAPILPGDELFFSVDEGLLRATLLSSRATIDYFLSKGAHPEVVLMTENITRYYKDLQLRPDDIVQDLPEYVASALREAGSKGILPVIKFWAWNMPRVSDVISPTKFLSRSYIDSQSKKLTFRGLSEAVSGAISSGRVDVIDYVDSSPLWTRTIPSLNLDYIRSVADMDALDSIIPLITSPESQVPVIIENTGRYEADLSIVSRLLDMGIEPEVDDPALTSKINRIRDIVAGARSRIYNNPMSPLSDILPADILPTSPREVLWVVVSLILSPYIHPDLVGQIISSYGIDNLDILARVFVNKSYPGPSQPGPPRWGTIDDLVNVYLDRELFTPEFMQALRKYWLPSYMELDILAKIPWLMEFGIEPRRIFKTLHYSQLPRIFTYVKELDPYNVHLTIPYLFVDLVRAGYLTDARVIHSQMYEFIKRLPDYPPNFVYLMVSSSISQAQYILSLGDTSDNVYEALRRINPDLAVDFLRQLVIKYNSLGNLPLAISMFKITDPRLVPYLNSLITS